MFLEREDPLFLFLRMVNLIVAMGGCLASQTGSEFVFCLLMVGPFLGRPRRRHRDFTVILLTFGNPVDSLFLFVGFQGARRGSFCFSYGNRPRVCFELVVPIGSSWWGARLYYRLRRSGFEVEPGRYIFGLLEASSFYYSLRLVSSVVFPLFGGLGRPCDVPTDLASCGALFLLRSIV